MAELKTRPTARSVQTFLKGVKDPRRRQDCQALAEIMQRITGDAPTMWGPSIVGFGRYHYVYDSGREGDFLRVGFSPRAQDLSVYLLGGFAGQEKLLARLGKHRTGKCCLYLKRLEDVHLPTLERLIKQSLVTLKRRYPDQPGAARPRRAAGKKAASRKKAPASKKNAPARKKAAGKKKAAAKKRPAAQKKAPARRKAAAHR